MQAFEAEEDLRAMTSRARQAEARARDAHDELEALRSAASKGEHNVPRARDQIREDMLAAGSSSRRAPSAFGGGAAADGGPKSSRMEQEWPSASWRGRLSDEQRGPGHESPSHQDQREKERLARALDKVQVRAGGLTFPPLVACIACGSVVLTWHVART